MWRGTTRRLRRPAPARCLAQLLSGGRRVRQHAVVRAVRHHAARGHGLRHASGRQRRWRHPLLGDRRRHRPPGTAAPAARAGAAARPSARQPRAGGGHGPRRCAPRALALHLGSRGHRPAQRLSRRGAAPRGTTQHARVSARPCERGSAWMKVAARWPMPPRPAVFIDKDGTLVHDLPYNTDPARVRFTPHAIEGLTLLARSGFALFVVTNQRGLATGRIQSAEYDALRANIEQRLHDEGSIALQGWYTCPHAPEITPDCACRKPAAGLLQRAADEHGIDL